MIELLTYFFSISEKTSGFWGPLKRRTECLSKMLKNKSNKLWLYLLYLENLLGSKVLTGYFCLSEYSIQNWHFLKAVYILGLTVSVFEILVGRNIYLAGLAQTSTWCRLANPSAAFTPDMDDSFGSRRSLGSLCIDFEPLSPYNEIYNEPLNLYIVRKNLNERRFRSKGRWSPVLLVASSYIFRTVMCCIKILWGAHILI